MVDRGVGVAVLRCGTDTAPGAKNQWGRASPPSSCLGGRRARTEDLRIKRAFWVCGLVRILLISCVIASQLFARHGGGSRARADSLRTPEAVSYTHLRAHETDSYLVCRLLLEKKKKKKKKNKK